MSKGSMDAMLGAVQSSGAPIELGGGLNFTRGLRARKNADTGMVDVDQGGAQIVDVGAYDASPDNVAAANDVALAAAINAALAADAELWWPSGVFLVSESLDNLHSVRHRGRGAIQRGSDVFYVEPRHSDENTLYLSATGSSANDGLTAAKPMATPQNAFDALKNYGPVLEGTWTVKLAATTWNGTVHRHSHSTPSKNPVIIQGPDVGGHPNVPTAIFDGNTGAVADDWAIRAFGYGVQIDIRDFKCQNYTGANGVGVYADYGAALYGSNYHGSGNTYSDIYLQGCQTVRIGGGIWASPRGALVNGCVDTTLGYGDPIQFTAGNTNCAIEWSRGSEGHVDDCEFNGCKIHVDIFHNARVHLQGNNFKNATTAAIRTRTGGFYYDDVSDTNNFNAGTADDNVIDVLNYAGSGESDEDHFLSQGIRRRVFDKNSHNLTGTTALTVMSTLLSGAANSRIKANWFEDPTKKILVRVTGRFVTASALSSIGVSLGGTEIDRITLTGGGPAANSIFFYECEIEAIAGDSQFKKSRLLVDGMYPRLQQNSPTVNTDVDLSLEVNGKLAAGGDSMDVFWAEAWLVG